MHECATVDVPEDAHTWAELPPISVDDVRKALRAFGRTALGQVKIHPRALDAVSDVALETLAMLFVTCERLLCWPDRVHSRLVQYCS